jgi:hypothetical protein
VSKPFLGFFWTPNVMIPISAVSTRNVPSAPWAIALPSMPLMTALPRSTVYVLLPAEGQAPPGGVIWYVAVYDKAP